MLAGDKLLLHVANAAAAAAAAAAARINGFTHLNLTKLDVLSDLPEIKVGAVSKRPLVCRWLYCNVL